VKPAASKTPASVTPAKPAVSAIPQIAPLASAAKTGPMRWSPVSQRQRTEDDIKPPFLGGVQDPKIKVKNVVFKPAVEINKRPALTFKPFEILDPSKKKSRPVSPDTTFNLPNGESIKAKEYYSELNRLEKEFNPLGYSLDVRRQSDTTYALARATKSTAGFETGPGMTIRSLKQAHDPKAIEKLFSEKRLNSKKALLVPMKTSTGQKPSGTGSASGQMQRSQTAMVPKEMQTQKETSAPQPNPYAKTVSADFLEFGEKDLFAASLEGSMGIKADPDITEVMNEAELWGYIFGEGFKIAGIGITTRASYRNGMLQFLFVGSIGKNTVTESVSAKSVPDKKPEEMSPLPEIDSGWKPFRAVDFEPLSVSTSFMAGPIPISVRAGVSIAAGINYSLYTSPVLNINHFTPWVRSDAYCQGGIDLVITGAGVRCNLTLIDAYLTMQAVVNRMKEWVTVNYIMTRDYVACAGSLGVYFYIYVPAFAWPPWDKKEFMTNLVEWRGWHSDDDKKIIVMQEDQHKLFQ